MSQYWLMDAKGGVLGPVSLQVIRDLVGSGRIVQVSRVSRDGKTFHSPAQLKEISAILQPPAGADRSSEELRRAETVRKELARVRMLTPSELFGVPVNATPREHRVGFLELAKRYHPGRLAKTANPELVRACMEMFSFLSEQMNRVETAKKAPRKPTAPPPSAAIAAILSPPVGGPRVEFRTGSNDRMVVTVHVPEDDNSLFTQHRLANLSSGGMFLSTSEAVPLGTRLDLVLRFSKPLREIHSRGVVIFENVGARQREPPGVGIRLQDLSDADRKFLKGLPNKPVQAA